MDCRDIIYSEDYYDLILDFSNIAEIGEASCFQNINEFFSIGYFDRTVLPDLNLADYTYTAIPKCFALMNTTALEQSGILFLQNQPVLNLKGEGILLGFIDTGITYENPVFQSGYQNSRILRLWDQTIISKRTPADFAYGTEYTKSDIDEALSSDNPRAIVPSTDEIGHGTFLASVAAGSEDLENQFVGAAPLSDIAVVKLKPAKQNLRDFYYIPEDAVAYAENDIMTAIAYLNHVASELNKPLVICLGLGSNWGSHGGNTPLSFFLDQIGEKSNHVVVVAAGNEANSRHHYQGNIFQNGDSDAVEVSVARGTNGFTMELWGRAPEIYAVSISSPTGERTQKFPARPGNRFSYDFIFEGSRVEIEYRNVGIRSGNQLIFFRFSNPIQGIWTIHVFGESLVEGTFHMWLPVQQFVNEDVFFQRPNPEVTITVPSTATVPITVGAYNTADGSLYSGSGRGYTIDNRVKPDFVAPGVHVYGATGADRFTTMTGTSVAAAITAGASALLLEWALPGRLDTAVNTTDIKNLIIRGADRRNDLTYPNPQWGYGRLNIYEALNQFRFL